MLKITAIVTFILTYFVILWGAFVRATHSGAGCGAHWPLCNGEVLPLSESIETIVEFTHRISSGLSALMVFALYFFTVRSFRSGTFARSAITYASVFMLVEVGIGASLVLYGWVLYDSSASRAVMVAFHLINSFLLMASLAVYVWTLVYYEDRSIKGWLCTLGGLGDKFLLVLFLLVGSAGAVTALGDTLFPATSLLEGIRQDLSPESHFLIHLRVLHPMLAIILSALLLSFAIGSLSLGGVINKLSKMLILLTAVQVLVGISTVLLLAPVYLQIGHLALSLVLWTVFVLLVLEREFILN